MSDLKTGIYTYLQTQTTLTSLVGTSIYPVKAKTNITYPYITYKIISGKVWNDQTNYTGLKKERVEFSCWALQEPQLNQIGNALMSALNSKNFFNMGGVFVHAIIFDNGLDVADTPQQAASQQYIFRRVMDFWFIFKDDLL